MAENLRNIRTRRLVFTQRNKDKLVSRQVKADKQVESVSQRNKDKLVGSQVKAVYAEEQFKLVDRQVKADKQGESVYAEEQIQIGRQTSKVRQTRRICLRRGTKTDW